MFKFVVGLIVGGFIVHTNTNIVNDVLVFVCRLCNMC